MKLGIVICFKHLGIRTNSIEANEDITTQAVTFTIVKGNDIGIIIMLQVFAVYLQYSLVIAEEIGDFTNSLLVRCSYRFYPFTNLRWSMAGILMFSVWKVIIVV